MADDRQSRIAAAVRAEMARSRRTQDELADLLDLPQPSISRRLRGLTEFRASELERLAEFLDVPVTTFLSPTAADPPPPPEPKAPPQPRPSPSDRPPNNRPPTKPPGRAVDESEVAA